jgi:uncharacterized protein (TIGR00255 family)
MTLTSMTGFATTEGARGALAWRWEARSVNARGLDLRFRLADGFEALEPELRRRTAAVITRGGVSISLRVDREGAGGGPSLDIEALEAAIAAAAIARAAAERIGLPTAPIRPEALLALRGVMEPSRAPGAGDEAEEDHAAILTGFDEMLAALDASRVAEGAALGKAIGASLDGIAARTRDAEAVHRSQEADAPSRLREKVRALLGAGADIAPERLAQELALLAVKLDVREELDRLGAHTGAARDLLRGDGAVGRRLDFLTQEFNREVNTLCSKSSSTALTAIGLEMKVLVDQMREQAQNLQ